MTSPDVWLRGPVPGVPPLLQPAAHALLQAAEDVARAAGSIPGDRLWLRPAGAASAGFHLKHLVGATDRLMAYGRGAALTEPERAWLALEGREGEPAGITAADLAARFRAVVDAAVAEFRDTPEARLLEPREIGRARLPTTMLGCWFHAGEHAARHAGQLVTTARLVTG